MIWNITEPARSVGSWPEEVGTQRPHSRGDGSPVESLGSHRARIVVSSVANAVWAHIPWRRRDSDADQKATLVVDAKTGKQIDNVLRVDINREYGDIVFQPTSGPGEYFVYNMPYTYTFHEGGGNYSLTYTKPKDTADPAWLQKNGLSSQLDLSKLPRAEVPEIQARTEFDRFDPMEVCATKAELDKLIAADLSKSYLLFPEDRFYPIRMKDDLPLKWIKSGLSTEFSGKACRNEFYPFQLGLYATGKRLFRVDVGFSNLKTKSGQVIPASAIRCFNSGGIDAEGKPFRRALSVQIGIVLPLWIGVQVPKDAVPGIYEGTVTIKPRNAEETEVRVSLEVTNQILEDCGDSELWRHSRLRWLDSTIGIDNEVTAPYTPVKVNGRTVSVLLRDIRFANTGLPESVVSSGNEILAGPVTLSAKTASGLLAWKAGEARVVGSAPAYVAMESEGSVGAVKVKSSWRTEYDGYTLIDITLTPSQDVDLTTLRLDVPFKREFTGYLMGLGERGGYRPQGDVTGLDSEVWLGSANGGMQCSLKTGWDLSTATRGITASGSTVTFYTDTGVLSLKAGQEKKLSLTFLPTPLKPLDPDHWDWRYHQVWKAVMGPGEAHKQGARVLNVHQGCDLNPYINYPFLTPDKLRAYANDVHSRGMKTKYYYTLRELSNYAVELWAFRAVEPNMFPNSDKRGGSAWLLEHVVDDYDKAWHSWPPGTDITDAAIQTAGKSRLMNYYLEGLHWLTGNLGDDGLYIDGLAYDRSGMRRGRKALDKTKPSALIDFHSGRDCICANKFLPLLPYVSSLWFGEAFDYNEKPDYWLVEVSGLPFGLWGEMLGGGNPWRGMVYGMTDRLGWGGNPIGIWAFWDKFGIQDSKMVGYWDDDCPVNTGRDDILATVYLKEGMVLLAIASWSEKHVPVHLGIDWKTLRLDPEKAEIYAPAIDGLQSEATFEPSAEIPVSPGRGWLLVVRKRARRR